MKNTAIIFTLLLGMNVTFAQGLLLETAANMLNINEKKVENTEYFSFASFEKETKSDSFTMKLRSAFNSVANDNNFRKQRANVLHSFTISDIAVLMEDEIETEAWMSEAIIESTENALETETWMSEVFNESVEGAIEVETWMTEAFTPALEEELSFETWMAEPMLEAVEDELETEEWMTESFSTEKALETEDWMLEVFNPAIEEELVAEDWMSQPF